MKRLFVVAMVGIIGAMGGCRPRSTPATEAPHQVQQVPAGTPLKERGRLVGEQLNSLATSAALLPANDEQRERELMAEVFTDIADLLPLLEEEPTGEFRQQVEIVRSSADLLGTGGTPLAVEPTVTSGLRATYNALAGVGRRHFADVAEVGHELDALRATVNELDRVHGPMHWLAARDAVDRVRAVVWEMRKAMMNAE